MLLSAINGPEDLAGLTYEELDALSAEIRELIVESVIATFTSPNTATPPDAWPAM